MMSDPWAEILGEEFAAFLRAPIKIEPISPPLSPNPVFAASIPRMKHTAGRGRGRSDRSAPREEPPRVNTKKKLLKVAVGIEQLVPVSANLPNPCLLLLVLRIVPRRS